MTRKIKSKVLWTLCAALLAGALAYAASNFVFCQAPLTTDKNSYIFQAKNFLTGKVVRSYPSGFPDLFIHNHIIMDKRIGWVSRYAPGHPLWLIPGILLGNPYLMSAFGATLALCLLVQSAGLLNLSRCTMAFLMLCSPPFIFTFGTLLSHTSGFVATSLMIFGYILWRHTGKLKFAILTGLAWGWLFHNRTLSAICISIPFGLDALIWFLKLRTKKVLHGIICLALITLGCALLLLAYNYAVTGDPLAMTHSTYDQSEALGFGPHHTGGVIIEHSLKNGLNYLKINIKLLDIWLFGFRGSLLIMVLLALIGWNASWSFLFVSATVLVWLGYSLFWYPGPDETGPGYYFETLPFIYLAGCFGLRKLWKWAEWMPKQRKVVSICACCILVFLAAYFMVISGRKLHSEFCERSQMLAILRQAPHNSLIFVEPGPHADYVTFNPDGAESDTLIVRELNGSEKAVIQYFPDKTPFLLTKEESALKLLPVDANKPYRIRIDGAQTIHSTGTNVFSGGRHIRIARCREDKPGWLAFGQKVYIFPGSFIVNYDIKISGCTNNQSVAAMDIAAAGGRKILASSKIYGNASKDDLTLEFQSDGFYTIEPRIYYNGCCDLTLYGINIREVNN